MAAVEKARTLKARVNELEGELEEARKLEGEVGRLREQVGSGGLRWGGRVNVHLCNRCNLMSSSKVFS